MSLLWNTIVAMATEEDHSGQSSGNILTHDFVLGFLALFTFIISYHALIPTLPIFLARSGSNEGEIGILVGIFGASSLIFRLVVGGALLRYSEKSVMIFGALLFAVTFLACIVLRPFWPFFVVRFLQGVSFACLDTAALAYVVRVTPSKHRGRAIGYLVLAPPFSQTIAPSLGMFLVNQYGFAILFLACTGLSLCAFLSSCMLKGRKSTGNEEETAGHNSAFFEKSIITPSIMNFFQNFVWGALIAFFPLYAIQHGIQNPGIFFSANAIMLITTRTLGGKILDTFSKERIILASILGATIAMITLSFSRTLPAIITVGMLWGISGSFFFPASMAYALDYAGSTSGAAVGTFRALSDLGLALGPVVIGIIIPFTGYQAMFLLLALTCLGNMGYFQFYVRKIR